MAQVTFWAEDSDDTVTMHGLSDELLNEWAVRVGKHIERSKDYIVLKFHIGKVEFKLFGE